MWVGGQQFRIGNSDPQSPSSSVRAPYRSSVSVVGISSASRIRYSEPLATQQSSVTSEISPKLILHLKDRETRQTSGNLARKSGQKGQRWLLSGVPMGTFQTSFTGKVGELRYNLVICLN